MTNKYVTHIYLMLLV